MVLLLKVKEDAEKLASSIDKLLKNMNEKKYSLDEVRKILADKSRLGFTEKIREILEKYGSNKLSGIDPSKYKDLIDEVEKL